MNMKNMFNMNFISVKEILIYLLLFNVLFLSYFFLQSINHPDNTYYSIIVLMKSEQFLYSYHYEFMKRGFTGTILYLFNIVPTYKQIYYGSLIISNIFLLMYITYAKKLMHKIPHKQFFLYILFFILSPAVALHLGYDAGRFDQITLVITIVILLLLTSRSKYTLFIVPILLTIGLLIHEAFLFINIPIILAVIIYEIKKKNYKKLFLYQVIITIVIVMIALLMYGSVDKETLDLLIAKAGYQNGEYGYLSILTRSLLENIRVTLSNYTYIGVWVDIMITLSVIAVYIYLYFSTFKRFIKKNIFIFLICISPFLIFIMFLLGIDFHRWFSLLIINLFLVFPYLIKELNIQNIYQRFSELERKFVKVGYILFILGPIGVVNSLPYVSQIIKRIF
jgi:hypothetical protein